MAELKLSVLVSGIGYHCDKSLLYYSAKLARATGFEVLPVPYDGFPEKVGAARTRCAFALRSHGHKQKNCWEKANWEEYSTIDRKDAA